MRITSWGCLTTMGSTQQKAYVCGGRQFKDQRTLSRGQAQKKVTHRGCTWLTLELGWEQVCFHELWSYRSTSRIWPQGHGPAGAMVNYRTGDTSLFCCGQPQPGKASTTIGGNRDLWGAIGGGVWRTFWKVVCFPQMRPWNVEFRSPLNSPWC